MQQTSENISEIAGAPAKAQAELQNPKRALTATLAALVAQRATSPVREDHT
jgi:hypothetical protein